LASAELFVIINLPKRSTGTDANVPLRGVEGAATQVRDHLDIIAGRMFAWGKNEVIVGQGAAREFAGLDVGSQIKVGRDSWPVVGVFSTSGGIGEIWTDATVLQGAYNRGDSFQSVHVRLASPGAFTPFKDWLTSNPQLNDDASELFRRSNNVFGFGPSVRWSLFEGGRLRGRVAAQEARAEQAFIRWERTVLSALEETETAMSRLVREQARRQLLSSAAAQARRAAELAQFEYNEGLTDFQAVLDSERALALLEDDLAVANTAIAKQFIMIQKALGDTASPPPS
jgi:hypothetical protein